MKNLFVEQLTSQENIKKKVWLSSPNAQNKQRHTQYHNNHIEVPIKGKWLP